MGKRKNYIAFTERIKKKKKTPHEMRESSNNDSFSPLPTMITHSI